MIQREYKGRPYSLAGPDGEWAYVIPFVTDDGSIGVYHRSGMATEAEADRQARESIDEFRPKITAEQRIANVIGALVEEADRQQYSGQLEMVRDIAHQLKEEFEAYRRRELAAMPDDPADRFEAQAEELE